MYIIVKVLFNIRRVELVDKREFAAATLDPENEIFVVYVAAFVSFSFNIYSSRQAWMVSLKTDEASTTVPNRYADFTDIFLPDLAAEILKHTKIYDHAINLINGK